MSGEFLDWEILVRELQQRNLALEKERDEALAWAEQVRIKTVNLLDRFYSLVSDPLDFIDWKEARHAVIDILPAEALAAHDERVRREMLEEAAKSEEMLCNSRHDCGCSPFEMSYCVIGKRIRALADRPAKEEGA